MFWVVNNGAQSGCTTPKVVTFVYSRRVRQYVVLSDSKDATERTTETQRTQRKVCESAVVAGLWPAVKKNSEKVNECFTV